MGLTEFGKELRKIRIEHEETMMQMSKNIDRSQSFLSAIETGRNPVPEYAISSIAKHYGLDSKAVAKLKLAAAKTNEKTPEVSSSSIIEAFTATIGAMDKSQREEFMDLMQKFNNLGKK